MADEVLFTDPDGNQAILHSETHAAGKIIRTVTYKGEEYPFVGASEAAEKILQGVDLPRCYIEAITRESLQEAEGRLKTGNLVKGEERDLLGFSLRLTLRSPICCGRCLIGALVLDGVEVSGHADFSGVTFSGGASCIGATFSDEAHFALATFGSGADFLGATFSGRTRFFVATFRGGARFMLATFRGGAEFHMAAFRGMANFGYATFSGEADFREATFNHLADFHWCAFLRCALVGARFEKLCSLAIVSALEIDLSGSVFTESVRLSPLADAGELAETLERIRALLAVRKERAFGKEEGDGEAEVEKLERLLNEWEKSGRAIGRVDFMDTLIQGELRCDFEHISPVKKGAFPRTRHDPVLAHHASGKLREAEKQYAWLKEQYRKQGAYGDEDEAHWWASECARRRTPFARNRFWLMIPLLLLAYLCYGILGPEAYLDALPLFLVAWAGASLLCLPRLGKLVVFRWGFGYGVRPWRVVITILVVVLAFGCLFWRAEAAGLIRSSDPPAFASPCLKGLYFSAITFATVGYGDVRALGWAASAAMVEGFLGILLNAALVVVIFRKMIR